VAVTIRYKPDRIREDIMENGKLRVLVVDDDDIIRLTLFEYLLHKGFKVGLAENGQKGLNMFDKMVYDFVVTDYGMPQMDGLKMAKEIKKKYPDAVVIMMSGDQKIRFQIGNVVNHFLEKPVRFDAVYNLMVSGDEFDTVVMAQTSEKFGRSPSVN
jgi:DNA-binding NtrC family response regulator